MELFYNASIIVKLVMISLMLFSVASWAIILFKLYQTKIADKEAGRFLTAFLDNPELTNVVTHVKEHRQAPNAILFKCVWQELHKAKKEGRLNSQREIKSALSVITHTIKRNKNSQTHRLDRNLNFLATTGATAPFIGLFGTVWGIMEAFKNIGLEGSASLAVVAPGISEALVATAIGLVAAIPAVIAYNFFANKNDRILEDLSTFGDELYTRVSIMLSANTENE